MLITTNKKLLSEEKFKEVFTDKTKKNSKTKGGLWKQVIVKIQNNLQSHIKFLLDFPFLSFNIS